MMNFILYLLHFLIVTLVAAKRPNIVLILSDDQDVLLGSVTPMKQVQSLIANKGATFSNAFVSTPICCPSRSSILTGLYMHNHNAVNNSYDGGCSSHSWQDNMEPVTFGAILHKAGYRTFYAGKYLNAYGAEEAGGIEHVPVGWDWWLGLKGNSRYYNFTLSENGTAQVFTTEYLTNVIQNYSLKFLDSVRNAEQSFLMVLAPPAPHAPFTPEPKYEGRFDGIKVPRTPNFNTPKLKNRHWLLNMDPAPLPEEIIAGIDGFHGQRWETLLSVDDMVAATINKLDEIGHLNNTYIIYTSDHGFHLGHFALPWDKRQPYEMDIRVPLFLRGPGIKPKSLLDTLVVNIDIAPTIIDIAELPPNKQMNGWSFLRYAKNESYWPPHEYFLLEYQGEGSSNSVSPKCPLQNDDTLSECYPNSACKCQDSRNNTYNCVRRLDAKENSLYCNFYEEGLKEYYDLNRDPYQLDNIYKDLGSSEQARLQEFLSQLLSCKAPHCKYH